MRISDWSLDVCSSDLVELFLRHLVHSTGCSWPADFEVVKRYCRLNHRLKKQFFVSPHFTHPTFLPRIVCRMEFAGVVKINRSEERRVGKGCVSTCRSRWWPDH